jgi:alpha-N-arabinofuranosidase
LAQINRRGFLQGVTAMAVGMTAAGCRTGGGGKSGPSGGAPVIAVNPEQALSTVTGLLTGVNGAKWYDDAFGLWDAKANRPVPDAVQKVRKSGVGLVRYPGGTSANLFNWQGAVGPEANRTQQIEGKHGTPVDSRYGPDEYMTFIQAIGATPQIMAPFANATPGEVAAWVAYMNAPKGTHWGDLRAANGHPAPYGVHYWEIGNELYGEHQRYWMSADDATALRQYAFGGTQRQTRQLVGTSTDHRPSASVSNGSPGQRFTVRYPPVVPNSEVVHVNGDTWQCVGDLSSAGPNDRVCGFEPATGTITFGDGRRGKIPPKGAKITADYDSGPHAGFVDYYKAMKAVDPTIQVLATWALIGSGELAGGASFPRLMAEHGHAHDYDGMTIHPYTNFSRDLHANGFPNKQAGHDYQMLGDAAAAKMVTDLQAEVRKYGKSGANVAVSECGALFFGGNPNAKAYPEYSYAMSHALYMASQWSHFANAGVPWTASNDLVSEKPGIARTLLGGAPGFVRTPEAIVREQLRTAFQGGGHVVESEVRNNIEVATQKTPLGSSYAALVTTASAGKDGTLNIVVVNRSAREDIKARVALDHRPAGAVDVSVVSGRSYDDFNNPQHPDGVKVETSQLKPGSPAFEMTFRAHSVTLLRIPAR